MSDDNESKTEEPTEKRLQEAWDEGNFAKAPDLQTVAVLLAAVAVLSSTGRNATEKISALAVSTLSHLSRYQISPESIPHWTSQAVTLLIGLALPMAAACAFAGALAGGLQTRFKLTPKALGFKFSRVNPASGLGRIFSKQGLTKLFTESIKLVLIGALVWAAVKNFLNDPIFYTPVNPLRLATFMGETASSLLNRCLLGLAVIGGVSYAFALKKTRSDLMMTKEEIKEEHKQMEGNPKVKAHLRQMARRLAQKQMLSAVETADVVVTNPTHFAVALKYERGKDKAPVLLAKGEGGFAKRIKALAAQHEVPMVENKSIARMLFKHGRVGKAIPVELYQAVADILAFVYKTHRYYFHQLKQRRAAAEEGK